MEPIRSLHHVAAVAGDAQQDIDFYGNILGQRLVKRMLNFDAPGTYHFYFGDDTGSPGSILTFFARPNMPRGTGETNRAAIEQSLLPIILKSFEKSPA